MDFLKTLLAYMAATLVVAVESTSTPGVTPVPTPAPSAETTDGTRIVETVSSLPSVQETATPTPTVSVTPPPVPTITPNLRDYHNLVMGDRGDDVRRLQEKLIEMGYLPEGSADGAFGRQTRTAVRYFQYYNGLTVDGVAGRATQTNLFENPDAARYPEQESPAPESSADATVLTPRPDAEGTEVPVQGTARPDKETAAPAAETLPPEAEGTDVPVEWVRVSEEETAQPEESSPAGVTEVPAEEAAPSEAEAAEEPEAPAETAVPPSDEPAASTSTPVNTPSEDENPSAPEGTEPSSDAADAPSSAETEAPADATVAPADETSEPAGAPAEESEKPAPEGTDVPSDTEDEPGTDPSDASQTTDALPEGGTTEAPAAPTADPSVSETNPSVPQEPEGTERIEHVDLDEGEEIVIPLPTEEPLIVYEDLAGWVVLNDSGENVQWTELEDGVPVVRSPRLQRHEGGIRISLDDLASGIPDWALTYEDHSLILEARGYTLALLNEDAGPVATVDGIELAALDTDFDFNDGHFIEVEFLTRALSGSWAWDEEEQTLMLRIPAKGGSSWSD